MTNRPSSSRLPKSDHANFDQAEPDQAGDTSNGPSTYYRQRIERLDVEVAELTARDLRLSQIRGIAFVVALGLVGGGILRQTSFMVILGSVAMIAFVALIIVHEQVQRRLAIATTRRDINRQQFQRTQRDWVLLPSKTEHPSDAIHHAELVLDRDLPPPTLDSGVAADLDLFGVGSLWQLVNQAHTPIGQRTLRDWLLIPATPEEITQRQEAVQRLAPMADFREHLVLHGRMLVATHSDPSTFVGWAQEGPQWLRTRNWLKWTTRLLAAIMVLFVMMSFVRIEWLLPTFGLLLVNVVVNSIWAGSIHDLFNRISAGNYDMVHYAALFDAVDELPDGIPKLASLKNQMRSDDVGFRTAFTQLQRIVRLSNGRKSRIWGIPWTVVQIFFFWDFHVLDHLERWQAQFGSTVVQWFDAIGQLESISSLATLAHDQPKWSYPSVSNEHSTVTASGLGHPLLPQDECVRNDVTLGPVGSFLLVTGSNMSGKSTLLRSVGVNTVLAFAGGPVCADQFSLPPVELVTSMRITDSLNSGVSFFMAELQRLKTIVDRARQLDADGGPIMLYLLDEILQGTNSAERHVAVTRVIGHLLACHTMGAVSTHDLELASAPELKNLCQLVHLRETIEAGPSGDTMRFDYVVHPGVTPTTNALKLLELVGLGDAPEELVSRKQ